MTEQDSIDILRAQKIGRVQMLVDELLKHENGGIEFKEKRERERRAEQANLRRIFRQIPDATPMPDFPRVALSPLASVTETVQDEVITRLRQLTVDYFSNRPSQSRDVASAQTAILEYYSVGADAVGAPTAEVLAPKLGVSGEGVTVSRVYQIRNQALAELTYYTVDRGGAPIWQEIKTLLTPPTTGIEAPQTPPTA